MVSISRLHFSQFHYKQIAICKQGDIFVDRQHETVAWLATEANKHFNVEELLAARIFTVSSHD